MIDQLGGASLLQVHSHYKYTFVAEWMIHKYRNMKKIIYAFLLTSMPIGAVIGQNECDFGRLRITAQAGWGYRLGKAPDQYADFVKGLRTGLNLDAGIAYHFYPEWGLGAMYSYSLVENEIPGMTESTRFMYYGPMLFFRTKSMGQLDNWALSATVSFGALDYSDKAHETRIDYSRACVNASVKAPCAYIDFGAEIRLYRKLFLTGKIYTYLSKSSWFDLQNDITYACVVPESLPWSVQSNLCRIGASAGLKIGIGK